MREARGGCRLLWPRAKSPTSPRRSATAAPLARPPTARACSEGDIDQAQPCASFFEAFRRAALLLFVRNAPKTATLRARSAALA